MPLGPPPVPLAPDEVPMPEEPLVPEEAPMPEEPDVPPLPELPLELEVEEGSLGGGEPPPHAMVDAPSSVTAAKSPQAYERIMRALLWNIRGGTRRVSPRTAADAASIGKRRSTVRAEGRAMGRPLPPPRRACNSTISKVRRRSPSVAQRAALPHVRLRCAAANALVVGISELGGVPSFGSASAKRRLFRAFCVVRRRRSRSTAPPLALKAREKSTFRLGPEN